MNTSPFTTPEGFFDEQRKEVLRATRQPSRLRFGAAAAAVLAVAGSWWLLQPGEPCTTYACLLEATPIEELPVEWAEQELLESGTAVWPEELTESLDALTL